MTPPAGAQRSKARKLYSFSRSFGAVAEPLPLMDYTYDNGKTRFNQVADGYLMGCRGYALSSIAGHEDDAVYNPKQNYNRLCAYEYRPISEGGQIVDALKFACVEGLMRIDETTDAEAKKHIRGKYFYVDKIKGYDWFDSHRLALRRAKVSISVGTIWFQEWMFTPAETGILTPHFVFDGKWDDEMGHNYEILGEKTMNWKPYLIVDAWLGRPFYFDRETFNKAFDIYGTGSWVQPAFEPKDILFVRLTILQRIVQLLARYISENLAKKMPQFYM